MPESFATVALIGLRGSGKTTVGRELARLLSLPFLDLDDEVARTAGLGSAGEVIEARGIDEFRGLERSRLELILEQGGPRVLATGGGAVEDADSRERLSRGATCVWLRAELAILEQRVAADTVSRPALEGDDPVSELGSLLERREPLYRGLADHELDTGTLSASECAQALVERLRQA